MSPAPHAPPPKDTAVPKSPARKGPKDILGRTPGKGNADSKPVTVERNHFDAKALSAWAVNIAVGCSHGCRFCYVPAAQRIGSDGAGVTAGTGGTTKRFTVTQLRGSGTAFADRIRRTAQPIDKKIAAHLGATKPLLDAWAPPVRPSKDLLDGLVDAVNAFASTDALEGEVLRQYHDEIRPPHRGLRDAIREHGILDPDLNWGSYALLRKWDPEKFLRSVQKAERTDPDALPADGNRAVMFCTTTDPFQSFGAQPGEDLSDRSSGLDRDLLRGYRRRIMVEALDIIRTTSTLRVRILTRGQPSDAEWAAMAAFNSSGRLLFGVSLPTLDDGLRKLYEPLAPSVEARKATLKKARELGIPLYVALAPTYPECDEDDLRATLTYIRGLQPVTIFHEPINLRAENVARMAAHAKKLKRSFDADVFQPWRWPGYAAGQLATVQRLATDLGCINQIHLWPDKSLLSGSSWRALLHEHPGTASSMEFDAYRSWIEGWRNRTSAWPPPRP